jgi:hypothetical protein
MLCADVSEDNSFDSNQSSLGRSLLSVCLSTCSRKYFISETDTPISMKFCVADLLEKLSRTFDVDAFSGVIISALHTAAIEY